MTTATRAPKGGVIAKNGEFYQGGCFLPTTTLGKLPARQSFGSRKVKVGPCEWVAADGDRKSIWSQIGGLCNDTGVVIASDHSLAYYGRTRGEVETLAAKWRDGERWL